MMRYLVLDTVFLLGALVVAGSRRRRLKGNVTYLVKITILLLALTLIFDNIIILMQIVSYYPKYLLGIYLYKAPIEDFAYTLAAVLIVPALWERKP